MSEHRARVRLSRLICFALRHSPASFGITLDPHGFVSITELSEALRTRMPAISPSDVIDAANRSQTDRYEISEGRLRLLYGHSSVPIRRTPTRPPAILYHATDAELVERILREGLVANVRSHVHLTTDITYARSAAVARGRPALLCVDAEAAAAAAVTFYQASKIVWLVEHVPSQFVRRCPDESSGPGTDVRRAQIRELFTAQSEDP